MNRKIKNIVKRIPLISMSKIIVILFLFILSAGVQTETKDSETTLHKKDSKRTEEKDPSQKSFRLKEEKKQYLPGTYLTNDNAGKKFISGEQSIDHVVWGSSCSPFPGEEGVDGITEWKRLNEKIKSLNGGIGLHARRSYDRAIPVSFSKSAMAPDIDLCPVSVGSFKPSWRETADGSNKAALLGFIHSIPDNHIVYLVFHHEPEDEALSGRAGYSPKLLQSAFAKFVEAVIESGKKNVHPCFVLMSWTFNPKSGRNPVDFNLGANLKPEQLSKVVAGLDGYADVPSKSSAEEVFDNNFKILASWGFSRFGIFETATHAVDTIPGRALWIDKLGEWAESRQNVELVCWFNSGVGQHAGPKGWFLGQWSVNNDGTYDWTDTDGSIASYAKLLKAK